MDPYLEKYWHEVHQSLIIYSRDLLQPSLPAELRTRIQQRVFVEEDVGLTRVIYPDVHIVEHPQAWPTAEATETSVALEEPILVVPSDVPLTEGYIEIVDAASGNRVVTVIGFLSPTNKVPGEGQNLYLQKQREVIEARANLVEIDLTRSGHRVLALPADKIRRSHRTTYQVCVYRCQRRAHFEVYRVPLTLRLPVVRIPLRPSDPDVTLDLQALIDQCYAMGRYDDLDYRAEPNPPLEADEAALVHNLLKTKGLR
jgi:hypothetical protein